MFNHFPFSNFHFQRVLFLSAILAAVQTLAAPLEVKDDFRSPRNKERPFRKATTLIVLHTTEAHARSSLNKLSERGEAHYCVTEKGEVYRIIDRDREAFHAGRSMWNGREDCDEYSVGIEVVGHHDQAMPLKQLEALKELVDRLQKIYHVKDGQVVCHSHVAYGAPNTWHKKKHRGRKRCGMLFAMPSVRAKLGLTARPAYDPDVKANRLVQADSYLGSILYGGVDTMAVVYGRARPQLSSAPPKVIAAKVKPVPRPAKKVVPVAVAKAAPKSASRPPTAQVRPATVPAKPVVALAKPPPPVRRPQLIVPKEEERKPEPDVAQKEVAKPEEESDWLAMMGLKGGYFKKKAKLVVPAKSPPPEPEAAQGDADEPVPESAGDVLPLPKDLHIAKMGDDVKDLAALAKLPGYARGGPVSANLSPYKIAGAAWRSPTTYYYSPRGEITTGDRLDEKSVEAGTFVFYRK